MAGGAGIPDDRAARLAAKWDRQAAGFRILVALEYEIASDPLLDEGEEPTVLDEELMARVEAFAERCEAMATRLLSESVPEEETQQLEFDREALQSELRPKPNSLESGEQTLISCPEFNTFLARETRRERARIARRRSRPSRCAGRPVRRTGGRGRRSPRHARKVASGSGGSDDGPPSGADEPPSNPDLADPAPAGAVLVCPAGRTLLTYVEIAARWGLSPRTVMRRVQAGDLRAWKPSRKCTRIPLESVLDYEQRQLSARWAGPAELVRVTTTTPVLEVERRGGPNHA